MAFTRDWLSSWILDHSKFKTQPSYVRGLMDDVGERLAAYLYGFSTGETFTGFKKATLITIGTGSGTIPTGTGVQAAINLQGKTIGGKVELITIDADGNEMQWTSKGHPLANDKWLAATDAAGTGGVNILKVNTGGALEFSTQFLDKIYPVGIVVTFGVSTNPATLLGVGTWSAIAGRVIVGISGDAEFDTLDETGGVKTVTLSAAESGLPAHNHALLAGTEAGGKIRASITDPNSLTGPGITVENNSAAAASAAHTNLQPYIVKYVWQRTA